MIAVRSLFARIYLTFVAGLFVALFGAGALTFLVLGTPRSGLIEPRMRGFARQMGLGFSRGVTADIAGALDAGDYRRVHVLLGELAEDLRLRVTVFDLGGRVLASTERGVGPPSASAVARLRAGEVVVEHLPGLLRAYAPIVHDGKLRGVVGMSPLLAGSARDLARPGLWLVGFFAAMAALTYPVARGMARRIEALQRVARTIASGDLESRAQVQGGDEIASLASAMNDMAATISGLMKSQKELVAAASHELRSPLARLKVSLEMAMDGHADQATRARHLADVESDIANLEALVDDLLLASRLELQDFPLRPEEVDLETLAHDVAGRYAGVTVSTAGGGRVRADARLLRRVIVNLVENARTAAGEGAAVEVAVDAADGDRMTLSVRDHGPGVPAAERERIFEPFHRLDASRSRDSGGAGLGLAIARRIAARHGGTLTVGDAPGGGAVFTLSLPR